MTAIAEDTRRPEWTATALRVSAITLVAAVWISSAIFGFYILVFFGGALPANSLPDWNQSLPKLYEPHTPLASLGIGAHFAAGAILLMLGPVQLIGEIRAKAPVIHHWIGRIYALAAFAAGIGGLTFIVAKGTVGGWPMNIGFSMYGALMVVAAVQTVRHAMVRRIDIHRAWAIRLFTLAVGSWLYRMCYGFWFLFTGDLGHTGDFSGWFDYIMDFAFFIPPLIVAELFISARRRQARMAGRVGATAALGGGAIFIGLATFFFTVYGWGPAIAMRFGVA